MGAAISEVLPFAVVVAMSPIPIVAVIVMLFSARAHVNGPVFLLGWVLALAVVSAVVYVVADAANAATDSTASDSVSWIRIGLGVLLLGMARRKWAARPAPGEEAPMPKWMADVDTLTPPKVFVLGLALAGINPKNLILTVGAAAGLGQLGVTTGEAVVALAVFVVLGSLSIAVPVGLYLARGEAVQARLDGLRAWLIEHNDAVMVVLLLVIGVVLIAKGIPPLDR